MSDPNLSFDANLKLFIEIINKSIFTKQNFFEEEQEVRIAYIPLDVRDVAGRISILNKPSDRKQRVMGNKITSYFEYDFSSKENIISEVILGPKCEASKHEVETLLASNGFLNIPVNKSKGSYR